MSEEIGRWHPRVDTRRLLHISGGVDTDWFQPLDDRRAARDELGYPAACKLLLTVRNLEPRTGVDNLIATVGELARTRRDFLLLVAGHGPLREKIAAQVATLGISDVVTLLGFVPEAELARLYAVADLYVQPDTDLQGFGLPIVEAMACGTPVLATPIGGALDILQPIDSSLLFTSTNTGTMAQELGAVLDNPLIMNDRDRYRAIAVERFSWPRIVDMVEEALESMHREHDGA